MSPKEIEIQEKIEKNLSDGNDLDTIVYKKVFQSVSKEPEFYLSPQFADRLVSKIELVERKSQRKEIYWLYFGILILFIAALVAAVIIGFKPTFGAFTFLASYSGLFAFAIAFILGIQWLDKKLIRLPSM